MNDGEIDKQSSSHKPLKRVVQLMKRIAEIDRIFAWSALGVVLALAFGVPSTYYLFVQRTPLLSIVTQNEINVIDVRDRPGDLKIMFGQRDVLNEGLNVRLITIKIGNSGTASLLQNYFDQNDPWGVHVSDGSIVEVATQDATSDYLRKQFFNVRHTASDVYFPKPIFDPGENVTLKITILHAAASPPSINAFGKIAGIDRIRVERFADPSPGRLSTAFAGGPLVHVIRAIAYPLFDLGLLVLFVSFLVALSAIAKNRRRKIAKAFECTLSNRLPFDSVLTSIYIEDGVDGLDQMENALEDHNAIKRIKERGRPSFEFMPAVGDAVQLPPARRYSYMFHKLILTEAAVSIGDDGNVSINPELLHHIASLRQQHRDAARTSAKAFTSAISIRL